MKKLTLIFIGSLLSLAALQVNAQTGSMDYFAGKWNLMVKGLPNGDTKMFVTLDKKDTAMAGAVQDSTGTEISKFSKVELTDSSATVYFTAQGYDVNLTLVKKDQDHITGNMMGMFDCTGDRVKQ